MGRSGIVWGLSVSVVTHKLGCSPPKSLRAAGTGGFGCSEGLNVSRWREGGMDGQRGARTDSKRRADCCSEAWMSEQRMDGGLDGWMGGWVDGWMKAWMNG